MSSSQLAEIPDRVRSFRGDNMNEKHETLMTMDEVSRFKDLERHKLSEIEKKALIFLSSHYASNPLPA